MADPLDAGARPAARPPAETPERPPSPCINVCRLDEHGLCVGCRRSGAEIGRWMSMSPSEQWQLIGQLAERGKPITR
jgi:uncharacterized protein